jgi:hypothetical protein
MKQTAVEWLSNQAYELFEQYSEGNFDRIQLNKLMVDATNKAKEMERKEHGKTWDAALSKYEVRAGNYMRAYEDFDDYYDEQLKQP